jgi:parallel beta-helix repeat protein
MAADRRIGPARRWGRLGTLVLIVALLLNVQSAPPARAAGIVVVKPSAMAGWALSDESPPQPTGTGSFVSGPATPPGGAGSVQFTVDATGSYLLGTTLYNGIRFDQLTTLSYSTYRASGGAALAASLQFNVDYNLSDANTAWQGRLVFEPYLVGTVSTGVWQTWSALSGPPSGSWWATGAPGNGVCPQANPCTTAEVLAAFPNAGIHATLGALFFKVGSGWSTGFSGNVDLLTVGIAGDNTLFDFEPETACTTLCYVNTATGSDSYGGDTPGSAKKTIAAALAQVSPGGTVVVAAGSYPEAVAITKSGVTLRGAGVGTNPATATIISGPVGGSSGVSLPNSGTTGVTVRDLRVQGFSNGGICATGTGSNGLTIQNVQVVGNTAGSCQGGIYINGPVSNVTITGALADSNTTRGIVIWNGFKQNITITNNTVTNNNCCGIELQDGTASGVTITGNTVTGNTDSGIAAVGLMGGAGPNLIANNTLTDNGRFGIEIKLPNGSGLESGDGSIVVRDNTVRRVTPIEVQRPGELRDLGGIVVIRRGYVVGNGNVDVPTGVVVKNNTVSGYVQSNPGSSSEGFGIVVEGLHTTVYGNTVSGSDVGIQTQAGHLPYTPNSNVDGNQADLADQLFGRGNSPVTCAAVGANTLSGNATDTRQVGASSASVTNLATGRSFCSIQSAIDDPATLGGHTIQAAAGSYPENVVLSKSVTLQGPNQGVNPNTAARGSEAVINPPSGPAVLVSAGGAAVDGFSFSGLSGGPAVAGGAGFGADASNVSLLNNIFESSTGAAGVSVQTPNSGAVSGWTVSNNLFRNLGGNVAAVSLQRVSGALLAGNVISGVQRGIELDTSGAQVRGTSISGATTGVLLTGGSQATLSGVQLSGTGAGVGLDVGGGASATLDASTGANLIDGFATGAQVAGALDMRDTAISNGGVGLLVQSGAGGVAIGNTSFSGQSGDYITLSGYPTDIDGRAAFFAGARGDSLTAPQYLAVQAKITDKNDNPALGLVLLTVPSTPTTTAPAAASAVYSAADQPVSLSAAVAGVTSGGTVTFTVKLGAAVIGAPVAAPVSGGSASAVYTLPGGTPAGSYTIEAVFTPAAGQLAGGSSGTAVLTVSKADTDTALSIVPGTIQQGQSVSFTAAVTARAPSSGVPTGSVTFRDGADVLATVPLDASGRASFSTSALLAGLRTISAEYSGDSNFNPSAKAGNLTVEAPGPRTVYLPIALKSGTGDLEIAAFTVTPAGPSFTTADQVLVSVTITNRGDAPTQPFWVDLYINPRQTPALNQRWDLICGLDPCLGIAWPVDQSLAPGQSLTLTSAPGGFPAAYSRWGGWLPAGTTDLYVLVDSWAPGSVSGSSGDRSPANNLAHIGGLSVTGTNPPLPPQSQRLQSRPLAGSGR